MVTPENGGLFIPRSIPPKDFQFPILNLPLSPSDTEIYFIVCVFLEIIFSANIFECREYIRMCQLQDSKWMAGDFPRLHHPYIRTLTAILSDFKSVSDVTIMRDYFMPFHVGERQKKKRLNWNPSRVL